MLMWSVSALFPEFLPEMVGFLCSSSCGWLGVPVRKKTRLKRRDKVVVVILTVVVLVVVFVFGLAGCDACVQEYKL